MASEDFIEKLNCFFLITSQENTRILQKSFSFLD